MVQYIVRAQYKVKVQYKVKGVKGQDFSRSMFSTGHKIWIVDCKGVQGEGFLGKMSKTSGLL